MELTDRIARIVSLDDLGLLTADVAGRLHILDKDLNLVRSSKHLPGAILASNRPIYTLAVAGRWVVTKDMVGNIAKWSLDTLDLVDYYDAYSTCDRTLLMDDEEPSPVMSRGITVWGGRVYVNNGYRQLVVLDLESFAIERIVPSITGDAPLENFCTDHPDVHVVSDKGGRLYFGSLDTMEFPTVVHVDESNVHRVCYDRRHQRFWFTQDAGHDENAYLAHGVAIIGQDGKILAESHFARNDVEFVAFSPDQKKAYAGGFDGVLHIFDNSVEELRIEKTITGFTHQLIDVAVNVDGSLCVLTQDGEVVKLDADGGELARTNFRRQCIWDIQASIEDPHTLYLAADDGVATVSLSEGPTGQPSLRIVDHHVTGFGFTRRVVPMPDGWLGLTWDRKVFRSAADGRLLWVRELPAFGHTIAVSSDFGRVLVATNDGGLELMADSGEPLEQLDVEGHPTWASTYLKSGERVLATRTGRVWAFEPDGKEVAWTLNLSFAEYPKRMWATQEALYIIGALGMKEIQLSSLKVERRFVELLENTVENGIVVGGIACAVTYGGQLAAYDYESGEIIGLEEDIPDFPKALTGICVADGSPLVIIGGRGGYLRMYRTDAGPERGTFVKLRETYLTHSGLTAPAALSANVRGSETDQRR